MLWWWRATSWSSPGTAPRTVTQISFLSSIHHHQTNRGPSTVCVCVIHYYYINICRWSPAKTKTPKINRHKRNAKHLTSINLQKEHRKYVTWTRHGKNQSEYHTMVSVESVDNNNDQQQHKTPTNENICNNKIIESSLLRLYSMEWNIRYFHSINGHINHSSAQALPANGNLRLEFIFGILGAYHSIYNCMLYSIWWRRRVFGYNSTYSFIYLFM